MNSILPLLVVVTTVLHVLIQSDAYRYNCESFFSARRASRLLADRSYGPAGRVSKGSTQPSVAPAVSVMEKETPDASAPVESPPTPVAPVAEPPLVQAVEKISDPDPETEPRPEPVKSVEEIIMAQAQDEAKKNEDRSAQLNLLQQQLSKSLAKKQEVDDVISREIDILRTRIQDIEATERDGLSSITNVLASLRTAADEKNELIADSVNVVAQLKEVRSKVVETSIAALLDDSVVKKQDLVDVERDICADIYALITEIEGEIKSINYRINEIEKILKTFPSVADRKAAQAYSWADVENFQKLIMVSLESSIEERPKIGEFAQRFQAVMQRRGILLGETPLPVAVTNAMKNSGSDIASKSIAASSLNQSPAPKVTAPTYSISELAQKLEIKDNDELAAVAIDAAKKTGASFVKTLTSFGGVATSALSSDEFADSKRAASLGFNALQDTFEGIGESYEVFSKEWDDLKDGLPDDGIDSPEYFKKFQSGLQKVTSSNDLKSALSGVSSSSSKTFTEYGVSLKLLAEAISNKMTYSEAWLQASSEISEAFKVFLVSFTLLGSRTVRDVINRQDRQLPPGK